MDSTEKKSLKGPIFRYVLTGILLVGFLVVGILFLKQKKDIERATQPAPLPEVAYYPVPKSIGPDSAPVKLIEYSDFQCPACQKTAVLLKGFLKSYPGKIQITYHHYPLTMHQWALYAHQAAECMHVQGKFWPFHDMLYEKQLEWSNQLTPPVEILGEYAMACGADMELFGSCMADEAIGRGILAEKEEGSGRGVSATPTLFLGEQRFVGPREVKGRGQNAIRKVLGLPPLPEEKIIESHDHRKNHGV